nr:hypothetical protein [Acidobacteriota bacterium]
ILRRAAIGALNAISPGPPRAAALHSNDYTVGIMEAGHLTADRILSLLQHVGGVTELVTHPGLGVDAYPHWRYAWSAETEALCDPRLRKAIADHGITLIAPSELRSPG